ncbi:hypothetical protein FJQ98_18580 [Lysinibacillus agricola]|uniref:Uncharacterized protein n=1 Tax=Lysinibacillus agricola TaxID=2590012 RepID=A0ABX7APQ6_9BACI|nr:MULTISPECIES: hypothetical protein [Lysinibacillus]KOS61805.1 hypothetical protein AN161_16025 [Lysinibacillus sp. FJAT-14222]QQP11210.1 hypothetical protein FJQ98_18580 [Lysinibacillus agricola]
MNLKEPAFMLKVRGNKFFNEELSCLGWQLAEILISLKDYTESHDWYIFDVLGTSKTSLHELFPKNPKELCIVLSTDELIDKVKTIIQFESGVFIAIQKGKKINWNFNHLPETEESEGLQHLFAEIEIRTFDYSFFEIYGNNIEVKKTILNHFRKN